MIVKIRCKQCKQIFEHIIPHSHQLKKKYCDYCSNKRRCKYKKTIK